MKVFWLFFLNTVTYVKGTQACKRIEVNPDFVLESVFIIIEI